MRGSIFFRIVLAIILVGVLVGAGVAVYNLGVAQGLASSGKLPATAGGAPLVYPYLYGPLFFPFGFGFGIFGLLIPIFFFFLIFGLIRMVFFRGWGRYNGRRWGRWTDEVPPQVEEWHRRMHEQGQQQEKP